MLSLPETNSLTDLTAIAPEAMDGWKMMIHLLLGPGLFSGAKTVSFEGVFFVGSSPLSGAKAEVLVFGSFWELIHLHGF